MGLYVQLTSPIAAGLGGLSIALPGCLSLGDLFFAYVFYGQHSLLDRPLRQLVWSSELSVGLLRLPNLLIGHLKCSHYTELAESPLRQLVWLSELSIDLVPPTQFISVGIWWVALIGLLLLLARAALVLLLVVADLLGHKAKAFAVVYSD